MIIINQTIIQILRKNKKNYQNNDIQLQIIKF